VKGSDTGNSGAYKNGEPCMRSNVFMAYLDHATLTLTESERFLPPLLDLCTSFSPTFHFVSSRIVIDPPGQRIPNLQADSDMIALQVWGEQRLKLCQSVAGLPVTARRPEPMLTPTMSPGDALYVPQGLEVRFEDSLPLQHGETRGPTMYAVLSVRTNEQELGTSLGRHFTDVLREADISKETDRFLRSAVTKHSVPRRSPKADSTEAEAERRAKLEAGLKAAVADITQRINATSLREHVAKRMDQLRKEQAEGAAKMEGKSMPDAGQQVLTSSSVRVSRGVICECHPGQSHALFTRGTETLPLPIGETASYLISELCDGKPHLVSSLTCSDPVERLCVCQILVFKSCLEIVVPGQEPPANETGKGKGKSAS